jgi:Ribonuclease G/E
MARMVDGRLEDVLIDSDAPRPGAIYRARADRPVKGMGGLFLDTPDGSAFLRQGKGIAPGDRLLVQVTGYGEAGKAFPVTTRLLFKSRHAIVTPYSPGLNISRSIRDEDQRDALQVLALEEMGGSDMGLILRTSCVGAQEDAIRADIRAMHELAMQVLADDGDAPEKLLEGDGPHDVAWREGQAGDDVVDTPGCFETEGVLDALDALKSPRVPLPGGGFYFIEPTHALVAVDVNTGNDTSPAAGLKANHACAQDLPRQLRLRGLGGQIIIDFAPMPRKDRRNLETALAAAFRKDTEETSLAGWTPLGNFELQRKRGRVPLSEVLP